MTDHLPEQSFHSLAYIYDDIGLSDYSVELAGKVLGFLQKTGWLGRYVLDLGCGTGAAAEFLAKKRLDMTCVDLSAEMVDLARQRLENRGMSIHVEQNDMRLYNPGREFDLVVSFNTINYVPSVRFLNTTFQRVNTLLKMNKPVAFDIWTIEGLAIDLGRKTQVMYDANGIFMTLRNNFDFEAYRLHQEYSGFILQETEWARFDEDHMLRGYPVSALASMLDRAGFAVRHLLKPNMEPYTEGVDNDAQIVIIAEKVNELNE